MHYEMKKSVRKRTARGKGGQLVMRALNSIVSSGDYDIIWVRHRVAGLAGVLALAIGTDGRDIWAWTGHCIRSSSCRTARTSLCRNAGYSPDDDALVLIDV